MTPYPHHDIRHVIDLNGIWDFVFLGDQDPLDVDISELTYPDRMPVPLAFDATPAYAGKRGLAVYRHRLSIPENSRATVHFGAVGMWCEVFVDGEKIVEHANGYAPFHIDVPPAGNIDRELVVLADNRFSYERSPLQEEYYDWYQYGGITRPAYAYILPDVFIDHVRVTVNDVTSGAITVSIRFGESISGNMPLKALIDGKSVYDDEVNTEDGVAILKLTVPRPTPWSPDSPTLHELAIRIKDDDYIVRFGLRTVTVDGANILINGEPVTLLGFCRHEAHPQFGPALPEAIMIQDLHQLKDMGCNFIRGSHYPQDQRFLDLCDELGFLVWEENTGWNNNELHLSDDHFITAQLQGITEMITASVNHPSVIMWGFLNEGHSELESARSCYERIVERIRGMDSTRLVTFADNRYESSRMLDLVDVVSFNFYPGWYHGDVDGIPEFIREKHQIAMQKAGRSVPFIISEIGAGAIYGWRDAHAARWSEQYQANVLRAACQEIVDNDRIAGVALWQFGDCRTSEAVGRALGRPRTFNNKGVVDEYRRPKLGYAVVKEIFTASNGNIPNASVSKKATH